MAVQQLEYRNALPDDINFVVELYNSVIAEGGFTADTQPFRVAEKTDWFAAIRTAPQQLFIVLLNDLPIGYFYFGFWRQGRMALAHTAEITYYLHAAYRRKGIGSQMIDWCIAEAKKQQFTQLLAVMLDINTGSKNLLLSKGFSIAGHLYDVAIIDNKICGQLILQKSI